METKSAMGVIVAAPTAGSCGCLPGTLLGAGLALGKQKEEITRAMLAAGLISRADFVRIDAILREKFSPVWGGLYHSVA